MPSSLPAVRRAALAAALLIAAAAFAQSDADLAKQLANPVANLISVPFQFNYDGGFRHDDGDQYYLNIQPVIPISISPDWNLISRTILPIVSQDGVIAGRLAVRPRHDHPELLPLAEAAGPRRADLGRRPGLPDPDRHRRYRHQPVGRRPDRRGLRQAGPWTFGALANHLWSVTGDDEDGDISATFLQPFVSYTTPRRPRSPQHRIDLRLGERGMVGADQCRGQPDGEDRRTARAVRPRRRATGPTRPSSVRRAWAHGFRDAAFPAK